MLCSSESKDMTTFTDIRELATEWGFDIKAMEADHFAGKVTIDELYEGLMEEIYGDGGLAGN